MTTVRTVQTVDGPSIEGPALNSNSSTTAPFEAGWVRDRNIPVRGQNAGTGGQEKTSGNGISKGHNGADHSDKLARGKACRGRLYYKEQVWEFGGPRPRKGRPRERVAGRAQALENREHDHGRKEAIPR